VPILGAMSLGTDQWVPWVLNEDDVRAVFGTRQLLFDDVNFVSAGDPNFESCLGPWHDDMGHGERLLEWLLGKNNW
jgi:hypothetical protein